MSLPPQSNIALEAAYVLFMDIVAYSRLPTDEQRRILAILQKAVRASEEFRTSESRTHLLCLPTGDGMVLAFFDGPEAPLRCAIELTIAFRQHPDIKVRMGIHAGPVYRIEDINLSRNVAGGGVNIAQRVMDCGDAGHILISESAAEYLRQVTVWSGSLHDLGIAVVKHGERIHVYNFYSADVGNPAIPLKISAARKRQKIRKVGTLLTLTAAVALATASYVYFYGRFGPRRTIAVLDLKNEANLTEFSWIGSQFSDELTSELGSNNRLRLVPRDRVNQTNRDLGLGTGTPIAMVLPTLYRNLAADLVVSGSYWDNAGLVRVEVQVLDSGTGRVVAQWSGSQLEDRVDQLAVQASHSLVRHLGVSDSLRGRLGFKNQVDDDPKYPETKKLLAIGQRLLRNFDAVQAKATLLSAASIEPNSPRIHAALGDAWSALGYREAARREFQRAYALSSEMLEKQRLIIGAKLSQASDQPEMAASDYGSLFDQFPDDIDIGLGLAEARIKASRPTDALDTIGRLRRFTSPSRDDPRIDLVEAEAEEIVSRFAAMESSAKAAIDKAGEQRMIRARGQELEGVALRRLGRPKEAISALSTAWSSYQGAGDKLGAATAALQVGKIRRDMGDLKEAEKTFRNCSDAYREVGNRAGEAESTNMIGLTFWEKGSLQEAKTIFQHGIELSESIGDNRLTANMLGNLGSVLYGMGDLDSPEEYHRRSIELYSALGDADHKANELNNLGNLYHDRGDLDAAKSMHEQAIDLAKRSGQKKTLAGSLSAYGELLTDMGDLPVARKQHEDALAIWTEIKAPLDAAYDQVALAGLDVEENKLDAVEGVTRAAIASFVEDEEFDKAVMGETVLIRSQLSQHRITDAQTEERRAAVFMSKKQPPYAEYEFEFVAAMVESESGKASKAVERLEKITAQLAKTRYVCFWLKGRLILDVIQLRGANSVNARADLRKVEEEAGRKGLGLIARKAAAATAAQHTGGLMGL